MVPVGDLKIIFIKSVKIRKTGLSYKNEWYSLLHFTEAISISGFDYSSITFSSSVGQRGLLTKQIAVKPIQMPLKLASSWKFKNHNEFTPAYSGQNVNSLWKISKDQDDFQEISLKHD